MMSKAIRHKILFFLFWTILIVSFIFSAFLIVLKANGYQLNYKHKKIVKTGMIILNGQPDDTNVILNGENLKRGFPFRLSNLAPGSYSIVVTKKDYQNWQKTVNVEAGKVENFSGILLFYQMPQEVSVDESISLDLLTSAAGNLKTGLQINGSEIIYQSKLISRFSQDVLAAFVFPDRQHIIFQLGREIRVVELDGSNNTLLFNLENQEPTAITFEDNGKTIIYLDGENIRARTIR